jgi:hypothetical protein
MMKRYLTPALAVLTVLVGSLMAAGNASASDQDRVIYKSVQKTEAYNVSRPEMPSGARVTLFANFLGNETGCVTFSVNGTSEECPVIEWKNNSVTTELPKLGLAGPKNAEIRLIRPDGRIMKTFRILYVPQPDILIHNDTVPQPLPPAPSAENATYASPVSGGIALYSK